MSDNYIDNPDEKRPIVKFLSWENRVKAKYREIVVRESDGSFFITVTDNPEDPDNVRFKSYATSTLIELQNSGLLQKYLAYYNNSEVYTIYKSNNKVKLDEMLKLDRNIAYYSIRKTNINESMYKYIVGPSESSSESNYKVPVIHDLTDPKIAYTGTASIGYLFHPEEIYEGHVYIIDFFDVNGVVLSSTIGKIVNIESLEFSESPSIPCVNIKLYSSQDTLYHNAESDTDEEIIYLYRGQNIKEITLWVSAIYSNRDSRLINDELSTSRLVITYDPELNINAPVGTTYDITVKYFLTNELTNNITITKKIMIVQDSCSNIQTLIPVPMIKRSSGVDSYKLFTFAYYNDGKLQNITNSHRLTIDSSFKTTQEYIDKFQEFNLTVGLTTLLTPFYVDHIKLRMGNNLDRNKIGYYSIKNAKWNTNEVNPLTSKTVAKLLYSNSISKMKLVYGNTFEDIRNLAAVKLNSITIYPTHFRVISVINDPLIHTINPIQIGSASSWFEFVDIQDPNKTLSSYTTSNEGVPYPVLVEFFVQNSTTSAYDRISAIPFYTELEQN